MQKPITLQEYIIQSQKSFRYSRSGRTHNEASLTETLAIAGTLLGT